LTEPARSERIGSGSLFDVTLGREDGRSVVMKRILPRFRREPEAAFALVREAKVLAALRHAALPELVRVGSDEEGPFLVETFVAGTSVRQLVDSWSSRGGVPPRLAAHVTQQAFTVLAELAALSGADGPLDFVHGDIGPDHVLLGPAGEARFIDFGASSIHGLERSLTSAGRGTLPFVAPEVARGDAPPGHASDVYALAATALFLASSGKPLCHAVSEAAMLLEVGTQGVQTGLFDEIAAFRPRERAALAGALAVDPWHRTAKAAEVATAFDDR
jgi:serine/threonine protein kinase